MARAAALVISVAACASAEPPPIEIVASRTADLALTSAPRRVPLLRPASSMPVIQIAAGQTHVCAVHADTTVSCWGNNRSGQVVDHHTARLDASAYATILATPVGGPVLGVLEVAAGIDRTCARRADGVWCWGGPTGEPEPIAGTAGAVEITRHCLRTADGAVRCWGDLLVAEPEPPLDGAIGLASAAARTCGLRRGGEVACFSTAPDDRSFLDKAARTVPGAVELAVGPRQVCVRVEDGGVLCWTTDYYYQTVDELEPHRIGGVDDAIQIVVGHGFGCAVEADHGVVCWGQPPWANSRSDEAMRLPGVWADELVAGDAFVCARSAGAVSCWGDNALGQLGNGWSTIHAAPIGVPGITDAIDVHVGAGWSCVRHQSGQVSCWGRVGYYNRLGGPTPRVVPDARGAIELAGDTDLCARFATGDVRCGPERGLVRRARGAAQIARSSSHGAAARQDGSLWSWGSDYFGAFGAGRLLRVDDGSGRAADIADAIAIATGDSTTCVVRRDGTVACLGRRLSQLDGGLDLRPAPVAGVDHAIAIAIAERTGCALIDDGTVRCWGVRPTRQAGQLDESRRAEPIDGLTDAVQISGSHGAICARRRDGTLWCWGQNLFGQLGDPALLAVSERPVELPVTDVVDVSVGNHVCAVLGTGRVMCWGLATSGQVGTMESGTNTKPTRIALPERAGLQ